MSLDFKADTARCYQLKDRFLNFCFILFSLVPAIVAVYFMNEFFIALRHDDGDWFHWTKACEDDERIVLSMKMNFYYYSGLFVVSILRLPQWLTLKKDI